MAQGCGDQEQGCTCPSVGLAGTRSWAGDGSGAGAEQACSSCMGQRWLGVPQETKLGERIGAGFILGRLFLCTEFPSEGI